MTQLKPEFDDFQSFHKQIKLQPTAADISCFSIDDQDDKIENVDSRNPQINQYLEGVKMQHQNIILKESLVEQPLTATQILLQALTERKNDNFIRINEYMREHMQYCISHMNILLKVQMQLYSKVHHCKTIAKSIQDFLSEFNQGYSAFGSHLLSVKQEESDLGLLSSSSKFKVGVGMLPEISRALAQQINAFCTLISNSCLTEIAQSFQMFEKALQRYPEEIRVLKVETDKHLMLMFKQYQLIEKLMIEGTRKGFDILFLQIQFIQLANLANKNIIEWGRMINFFWKATMNNHIILMRSLSKHVNEFLKEVQNLEAQPRQIQYFHSIQRCNSDQQIKNDYSLEEFLDKQDFEVVYKAQFDQQIQQPYTKFEQFCQMQIMIQGATNLNLILQKLVLKRFNGEILSSDKKLNKAEIISTMDGNIVFVLPQSENKAYSIMDIREIHVDRIDDLKITVNQKRSGILRKTYYTQTVVFKTKDETDEFQAFVARNPEERESILL